jgi:hypothetical protein
MRDRTKKKDDEMLISHAPQPEPEQEGREPTPTIAEQLAGATLEEMTARLKATSRASERAEILMEIQRRFGNEAAEQAVSGARAEPAPAEGAEGEGG